MVAAAAAAAAGGCKEANIEQSAQLGAQQGGAHLALGRRPAVRRRRAIARLGVLRLLWWVARWVARLGVLRLLWWVAHWVARLGILRLLWWVTRRVARLGVLRLRWWVARLHRGRGGAQLEELRGSATAGRENI